jgi:hypothetical protein
MLGMLIALALLYGLLFVLPAVYEEKPRKTADLIAALLFGMFLIPSSSVLTFVSTAVIDSLGLDKYLPGGVLLVVVILLASLTFTLLSLVPLLQIREKREIKKPVEILFLASFLWGLILVTVFGWLSV